MIYVMVVALIWGPGLTFNTWPGALLWGLLVVIAGMAVEE